MRSSVTLLFLVFYSSPSCCQVAPDEAGRKSTVRIVIVDSFGLPLDSASVYMQHVNTGHDGPRVRIDHLTLDLPYGNYRFTVDNPGFESTSRIVSVHDKSYTVIIGLVPERDRKPWFSQLRYW